MVRLTFLMALALQLHGAGPAIAEGLQLVRRFELEKCLSTFEVGEIRRSVNSLSAGASYAVELNGAKCRIGVGVHPSSSSAGKLHISTTKGRALQGRPIWGLGDAASVLNRRGEEVRSISFHRRNVHVTVFSPRGSAAPVMDVARKIDKYIQEDAPKCSKEQLPRLNGIRFPKEVAANSATQGEISVTTSIDDVARGTAPPIMGMKQTVECIFRFEFEARGVAGPVKHRSLIVLPGDFVLFFPLETTIKNGSPSHQTGTDDHPSPHRILLHILAVAGVPLVAVILFLLIRRRRSTDQEGGDG